MLTFNFDEFINESTLLNKLRDNGGAKDVFEYLSLPSTIQTMIIFTEMNEAALTGIVQVLENKFRNNPDFPLTEDWNRTVVGKMIRFILVPFGYRVIIERAPISSFANSNLFITNAIYGQTAIPRLEFKIKIVNLEMSK